MKKCGFILIFSKNRSFYQSYPQIFTVWLFVAKPILSAKNVINGHRLYVLDDILCPCNQCFWVKSPFCYISVTVSHNITHSTKADMLTHMFYLDTRLFTQPLGFHMQIPILMIMAYVIGIHGKKRPMNLVLINYKYSQRNANLGITFFADMKTCFYCNQNDEKLNVEWKIMVLVKN